MNSKAIEKFYSDVASANSELAKKELFKTLLVRLFDKDIDARRIIDKMSLGAAKTVFNIPLRDRLKTGQADTQYNNVIIEFEKDLGKTGAHAKEQLAEYLAGNWKSGADYNFVLISTDGIRWLVFAPNYEKLIHKQANLSISDVVLKQTDMFTLNEHNAAYFFFFLDRYLFKTTPQAATLENITRDFGGASSVFINSMNKMSRYLPTIENDPTVLTAYEQWKKFLIIAYGTFDDSKGVFFVHTYLSVFAKIIAYKIISNDEYIDEDELGNILDGTIFNKYHVERFIENDFYSWVSQSQHLKALTSVFRAITQRISEYDFRNVKEDILKGVYQELIDLETRHSLGEYFTPDWLCERIVEELPFREESKILDPACGSGSFLRAAIVKLRREYPRYPIDKVLAQVVGIDIHPLSVQIAKTTVLIAVGAAIRKLRHPVALNVFLANSLRLPLGTAELFGQTFEVTIDRKQYPMEDSIFTNSTDFDNSIELCNAIAEFEKDPIDEKKFRELLMQKIESRTESHFYNFYKIYIALRQAKIEKRDSIWKFILQNLYKPILLKERFDYVVGNPPWLTYSDVTDASYQSELLELSKKYDIVPRSKANMPHLEIAAMFLAHSSMYFVKNEGKVAFVLPRAFLTADQHDKSRSGMADGFRICSVWDLSEVSPLFRVPSCVYFVEADHSHLPSRRKISDHGIKGLSFSGKLRSANMHWNDVSESINQKKVTWFYSRLSQDSKARSALTTEKIANKGGESYYASRFKQGATIVPRTFYFITPEQEMGANIEDSVIQCKSIQLPEAKEPWKHLEISGRVNTKYLFRTALSKNIVPFALVNPLLVLLPIVITEIEEKNHVLTLTASDIFKRGDVETAEWFRKAETMWAENRTENNTNEKVSIYDYLNWQEKLTQQKMDARFLVLYTASAKDANAVVLNREKVTMHFIVESKAYWFGTNSKSEANFLASFLNSGYANKMIKNFQSRGLFGPRDVHKSILGIPFPQFDSKNGLHLELSELGESCTKKVKNMVGQGEDLEGHRLGSIRSEIRAKLKMELGKIDKLIAKIVKD